MRNLIYVLVSKVFHNVHFRHFGELKMRFLNIRQQVGWSQSLCIYLCWDSKYLQRPPLSHSYYCEKVILKCDCIILCKVYSAWPRCFHNTVWACQFSKIYSAQIDLIKCDFLNLAQDIVRRFFWSVLCTRNRIGIKSTIITIKDARQTCAIGIFRVFCEVKNI